MKRFILIIFATAILSSTVQVVPAKAASQGIVMNFADVDIATMVKFISELTGKNFVLDERVKGKISIFSPSRLSVDEAFSLFTSVLELKGFTLVQAGKAYKIVPLAGIRQSGMKLTEGNERIPISDAYQARVFSLSQISSQEALTFLQPLVSKDGHIASFGPGNMLLVVDAAANIQKVSELLALIDTSQRRVGGELIYLKHSNAESVATILREWLGGKGTRTPATGSAAQQPINTAGAQIFPDQRLNALLIFAGEQDKKDIRSLVETLDITQPSASSKINVVFLEHTDATEMAKVLEGVVKGITAQTTGQPTASASQHLSPLDNGKITITPDKTTNSLVIMASPTDYNNLTQVIKKLDRRSKQVHVQVLIAEISLDKSREFGLQSGVAGAAALNKYISMGGFYDPMGALTEVMKKAADLKLPISGSPVNAAAVLKALDSNGLINILSTPNILTTDNREAEINVGENVPFKSSQTISNYGQTQSIERKDIGINLKIKPQISEGDFIRMDIYQEISQVKQDKGDAEDLVTTKRSAKTSVVVKDKETIVIGGLIQDTEDTNVQKFPVLGDIPGLGWLFKTSTKTRKKTNLMILLTPQVVRDARDLSIIADEQRTRFGNASNDTGKVDVQQAVKNTGIKPDTASKEKNDK